MSLKIQTPWNFTYDEFVDGLLFHASSAVWDTNFIEQGGDGVFWTTDSPLIASTYLSKWVGETMTLVELPTSPSPNTSYRSTDTYGLGKVIPLLNPDAHVMKETEIMQGLADLGYQADWQNRLTLQLRQDSAGGKRLVHADDRPLGRMVIIDNSNHPAEKVVDLRVQGEGDLQDSEHLHLDAFKQAFQDGAMAIKINDFCQSKTFGNFGHESIGFSSQAISHLQAIHSSRDRVLMIPATYQDLPEKLPLDSEERKALFNTCDSLANWHFEQVVQAFVRGEDIRPDVLQSYYERLVDHLAEADDLDQIDVNSSVSRINEPTRSVVNEILSNDDLVYLPITMYGQNGGRNARITSSMADSLRAIHVPADKSSLMLQDNQGEDSFASFYHTVPVPVLSILLNKDSEPVLRTELLADWEDAMQEWPAQYPSMNP